MAQLNDTVITGSLSVTDKINGPIADAGNGAGTIFAYSKAGVTNPDWLAAWNGYELRAVLRSGLNVGSANDLASGAVLSKAKGGTGVTSFDDIPTDGSEKPVTSGGLYDNITRMSDYSLVKGVPSNIYSGTLNGTMCYFNGKLYIVDYSSGVYSSSNGINFTLVSNITSASSIFAYNKKLYVGGNYLYTSTNGTSFTQHSSGLTNVTCIYGYADRIIVNANSVLYKSDDNGVTFTATTGYPTKTNSLQGIETRIVACSTAGLYQINVSNLNVTAWTQYTATGCIPTTTSVNCYCEYDGIEFYGTDYDGLYILTGSTFTKLAADFSTKKIKSLCACNGYLYVGTDSGLFYSNDGTTFVEDTNFSYSDDILNLYNYNELLYVTVANKGIYRYNSDGQFSYNQNENFPTTNIPVLSLKNISGSLYVGTYNNNYYTSDDEKTFTQSMSPSSSSTIYDIIKGYDVLNLLTSNNLYYKRMSSSTFSYNTFKSSGTYSKSYFTNGFTLFSGGSNGASNCGVYYRSYGGTSLLQVSNSYCSRDLVVSKFCTYNNKIYVGCNSGSGLYVSSNVSSRTYTHITGTGFDTSSINSMVVYNGKLYVFVASRYLYSSSDGETFTQVSLPSPLSQSNSFVGMLFVYMGKLYLGTGGYGLYSSSDGETFTQVSYIPSNYSITCSCIYNGRLFMGCCQSNSIITTSNARGIYVIEYVQSTSPFIKTLNDKYINKKVAIADLKSIVADSSDFADFKSRIAAL